MFTVIIAEKEYIDKVNEYDLFLKPFLESEDVKFCQWNTQAERLSEMLPTLADQVGRRKEWRAIIICNDDGLEKQNPFDLVTQLPEPFTGAVRGVAKEDAEAELSAQTGVFSAKEDLDHVYSNEYKQYLQREHLKKLEAYDEAATKPLTRLVTFFCNTPTVTKEADSAAAVGDPDYHRYIEENRRKQALRAAILGDELTETAQPTEVLCIAKRTYVSCEDEFDTMWSIHTESEYSRFYDRNLYFDKMRYLVFDILPKTQRDYTFDYIRFLYATILLASNDIPNGCLAAERVYRLECDNDENALRVLLQTYEAKLNCTKEMLNQRIREIREKKPLTLTDNEAQRMFNTRVEQTVVFDDSVQSSDLYARSLLIGLANGCQRNEEVVWEEEYSRSRRTLSKMLKQTRRALRRATTTAQNQQDVPKGNILRLNEFQLEDVRDFVEAQELEMLKVDTVDLYNEEALFAQMEKADKLVKEKIETRMFRKTTLALGGVACGVFLLGFFTVFLKSMALNFFNFGTTLLLLALLLGAFALAAVITLFFMRGGLVAKFREFNDAMRNVDVQIHNALGKYTKYLTHACNVRRGYAVLNTVAREEDPDAHKAVLYMKHITDIEMAKAATQDVFGQFMVGRKSVLPEASIPYDFNFDQPADYRYALPYTNGTARKITFIQPGVTVQVPVEFVKEIMVRREELYE